MSQLRTTVTQSRSLSLLPGTIDEKKPRSLRAGAATVAAAPRQREPLARTCSQRRAVALLKLIFDLSLEHVPGVPVLTPLLPQDAGLVLDDGPSHAVHLDRA